MSQDAIVFVIAFFAPLIFYRTAWVVLPMIFNRPFSRTVIGVRVHHLHYGMVYILIGAIFLLTGAKIVYVAALLGIGLGLMFDLFISSLYVETDRQQELLVYRKSLAPSIILFAVISILVLILAAIVR